MITILEDLFVHERSDVRSAERLLTKALPHLARAARDTALKDAFEAHLEETHGQVERLDRFAGLPGAKRKRIKCTAMEGRVEAGKAIIDTSGQGPLRDAALFGGARKVAHCEIAAHGTLAALARQRGCRDALPLWIETLDEEKAADEKRGKWAEGGVNQRAAAA